MCQAQVEHCTEAERTEKVESALPDQSFVLGYEVFIGDRFLNSLDIEDRVIVDEAAEQWAGGAASD